MDKIIEMRQKRAALVAEGRKLLDENPNGLSAEQRTQYDKIMADVDKMGDQITLEERQQKLDADMRSTDPNPFKGDPNGGQGTEVRASKEYRESFNRFLTEGRNALDPKEIRAMQADNAAGGGFLVAPEQFVAELIKGIDDMVHIRGLATVYQLAKAESLGVPTFESDLEDAEWTAEIKTGSDSDDMTFGKREFKPHPLAKRVKISNRLITASAIGIEALVRERLAYKHGIAQEKAFMTGDGQGKPLGVFTASTDGIGTDRDVVGGSATAITCDGLIDVKYELKDSYVKNARWLFHRDAIKNIRKLKDGNGQYIWQPGITGGAPDRILEIPYITSEFAPKTFTTGKYVGLLGDFKYYWIADALNMSIQRLAELYAEENKTGFIGRMETDGAPVLAEAFVRVKLG